ncbi:RecT family recombinase [Vogesella mureinivorans]|uniref:RecT family recombinase n=1 Tax=Vogesella mureinivorans TaxID=657276 RepID=UPI00197E1092|nr:RecT family recombinase [Vogesella mureinivorans]
MNDIIEHQGDQLPAYNGDQTSTTAMVLDSNTIDSIMRVAEIMASGKSTIPQHLRSNPGDCMAVVMQAMQWKMNPFAVAQKTHLVNGQLGYEAQLVNAVVQATGAITGRFHYEYQGDGLNVQCRVGAVIRGENEITWNEWLSAASVTVKNSPLWKTNPKQQLGYLQVKNWARAHTPGAILGVYTPEELETHPRAERDITPQAEQAASRPATRTEALKGKLASKAPAQSAANTQALPAPTLDMITEQLRQAAGKADMDRIKHMVAELPEGQYQLGVDAYNARAAELKSKAPAAAQQTFDTEGFAARIAACTDIDTLDVMADELRVIEGTLAHEDLLGLYRDRRAELAIG